MEKTEYRSHQSSWSYYPKIIFGVISVWSFWLCLLVLMLRWVNPPFTAFTLQENWEALGKERYSLNEHWTPIQEIPEHLKLALIASEDQRFYTHWGLDLEAIKKAMEEQEKGQRVRGASTISQQVAKNLFLVPAKSYLRKGVEAALTVLIELFWTKDRILEMYFNIAEFGPGMYGISTATDFYYHKKPAELTPKEAARMITVLPSPHRIEPVPASAYVKKRSRWILRNMQQISGVAYLPKPKPAQTDSVQTDTLRRKTAMDSLDFATIRDSMKLHLDSLLSEIELGDSDF